MLYPSVMSRPQYDRYASEPSHQQQYVGNVVNGGLIDFQDNLHRGVSEYLSPQQMVAAGYPQQAMVAAGYPQQAMVAAGYPQQAMVAAGYPQQPQAVFLPNVAQPAQLAQPQQPQQASCFSGPPSFIHVNGITYKPVEQEAAVAQPAQPAAARATAAETATKPLTEDELYHAIDERVSSRVEDYVSRKLRHHSRHHEASDSHRSAAAAVPVRDESPSPRRHHTASAGGGRARGQAPLPADDIEAAVQRVLQANASMFPASKRQGLGW